MEFCSCLKVDWLEEGGGIGGDQQQQGGQVGGQQLRLDLPLQGDHHVHLFLPLHKSEVCDGEHDQVFVLKLQLLKIFCLTVFVHHQHLLFDRINQKGNTDRTKAVYYALICFNFVSYIPIQITR